MLLMKPQVNRVWIKFHRSLYMPYAWTRVGDTLDTLLQSEKNEDIFRNEKCKVSFGVK